MHAEGRSYRDCILLVSAESVSIPPFFLGYGSVRNLTAKLESVGDEDTVMCVVSWLPPQEDELFHAALHYHLTLATVTAGGVHTDIRYFNVSMVSASALLITISTVGVMVIIFKFIPLLS